MDNKKGTSKSEVGGSAGNVKKIKRVGPIRTAAVVPTLLLILVGFVYFRFAFDSNLKSLIEYVGTMVNGAEVNVGSVETSFLAARVVISNVEVTDPERPSHNLISLGTIRSDLKWDALLRAKILIEDASVRDVRVGSKRRRPGKVVPPTPPGQQSASQKQVQEFLGVASDKLSEGNENNLLGKVSALAGGESSDKQLEKIKSRLVFEKNAKELGEKVKNLESTFMSVKSTLPQPPELEGLEKRAKAIKTGGFKDPSELKTSVDEFNRLLQDLNSLKQRVGAAESKIKGEVAEVEKGFKSLNSWIDQDIKTVRSSLEMPGVDGKSLSQDLFQHYVGKFISPYKAYIDKIEPYLPNSVRGIVQGKVGQGDPVEENKSADILKVAQEKRSGGIDFHFPKAGGYPLFWAKLLAISSSSTDSELSLDLEGSIEHLSSDQKLTGQPILMRVLASLPKEQVKGVDYKLRFSSHKEPVGLQVEGAVESFPMETVRLLQSDQLKFFMKPKNGSIVTQVRFEKGILNFQNKMLFKNLEFDVSSKEPVVEGLLVSAVRRIQETDLTAKIEGPIKSAKWTLSSRLGDDLSRAIKAEINQKLAEIQKRIEAEIVAKINAERKKLESEFAKVKSQAEGELSKINAKLEAEKGRFEAQKTKAEESAKKQILNDPKVKEVENKLKNLNIKGLKF